MAQARSEAHAEMERNFLLLSETYSDTAPADPYPLLAELRETQPVKDADILARFGCRARQTVPAAVAR